MITVIDVFYIWAKYGDGKPLSPDLALKQVEYFNQFPNGMVICRRPDKTESRIYGYYFRGNAA